MVQAILNFELPYEEDAYKTCMKAQDLRDALGAIQKELFEPRVQHGYGDPLLDSIGSLGIEPKHVREKIRNSEDFRETVEGF